MNYEEAKKIPISAVREILGHAQNEFPEAADAVEYVEAYLKASKEDFTRFDAVRWLRKMFCSHKYRVITSSFSEAVPKTNSNEWRIVRLDELEDLALRRYLEHRGIDADLAKELLQEVYLHNYENSETMYALGFQNEEGGFSLQGPFINILMGRKAISILRRGNGLPATVHIFGDFFDMLAAFSAYPKLRIQADIICLNSPDLLGSAYAHIAGFGYSKVYSWFPNSPLGIDQVNKLTGYVKTDKGLKHMICNYIYREYEDVATWRRAKTRNVG